MQIQQTAWKPQRKSVCVFAGVYVCVCVCLPNSSLADTKSSLIILGHTHLVVTTFYLTAGIFGWIQTLKHNIQTLRFVDHSHTNWWAMNVSTLYLFTIVGLLATLSVCIRGYVCVVLFIFLGGGVVPPIDSYSTVETCLYPVLKAIRVLSILTAKNRWNCL